MIALSPEIKLDVAGGINNFNILLKLSSSSGDIYHISDSHEWKNLVGAIPHHDDLLMKVGAIKESVDISSKKIKLSGTSISINNSKINGKRFSDNFAGGLHGAVADLYIKSGSCDSLSECLRMASLKVTKTSHKGDVFVLTCEDRFIDEMHKELPLSDHTLYDGENTFVGDNERRIPILYGHLKKAPCVVYYDKTQGTGSPLIDGSVYIVPDSAFLSGNPNYNISHGIIGIKPNSPYIGYWDYPKNQLPDPDILTIKLGDYAAIVYDSPPVRLHEGMVEGRPDDDYSFSTKWKTQFHVSEDRSHISLFTDSHTDSSNYISDGTLLCGEISNLIGANTYKAKIYRPDNTISDSSASQEYTGDNVKHRTSPDTILESTSPNDGNFNMLSLPAIYLDDISDDNHSDSDIENGIVCEYNTEQYVQAIDFPNWTGWAEATGAIFNWDMPIVELEFESMKASANLAKGHWEDSFTDATLIGCFTSQSKCTTAGYAEGSIPNLRFSFYPAQGKQETPEENITEITGLIFNDSEHSTASFEGTTDILGVPEYAYGSISSGYWDGSFTTAVGDDDYITVYFNPDWDNISFTASGAGSAIISHYWTSSDHICFGSAMTVYQNVANITNQVVNDTRHPFYTPELWFSFSSINDGAEEASEFSTSSESIFRAGDFLSKNIYTALAYPTFAELDIGNVPPAHVMAFKSTFTGMLLKRNWYQKEVFSENFFVNAKGRFREFTPHQLGGEDDQVSNIENLTLVYKSIIARTPIIGSAQVISTRSMEEALLQLYDYLTNDDLKYHYHNGLEYEIVITHEVDTEINFQEGMPTFFGVYFDNEVVDIHAENDISTGDPSIDHIDYKFILNSKLYLNEDWYDQWGTDFPINPQPPLDQFAYQLKLRYARKVMTSANSFVWEFLDELEDNDGADIAPSIFKVTTDGHSISQEKYISFSSSMDFQDNRYVYFTFGENGFGEGLGVSQSNKELIRKPSNVTQNILSEEFGVSGNFLEKNIFDDNYKLDFSLYKAEEGVDVMQKIAQCSPFLYRTRTSTGEASIVGIKHIYDGGDVDKKINVNQIMKYTFSKTKKEAIALKCRVKYGFDYVKEDYSKVTSDITHGADLENVYASYYNISDKDTYTQEYEAPYVQDRVTAEILAKHLFEINKNQHLNISFQIPISDGLDLETGDIISFIGNDGFRSKINDTNPYGLDMRNVSFLYYNDLESLGQAILPYFMITSISKDLSKVDIVCTQMHELAPSSHDNWSLIPWEEYIYDEETGEWIPAPISPIVTELTPILPNPQGEWISGNTTGYNTTESRWLLEASDEDNNIVSYTWVAILVGSGMVANGEGEFTPAQQISQEIALEDFGESWGLTFFVFTVTDETGLQSSINAEVTFAEYVELPIASFTMFYDGTTYDGIEFFDGDTIPATDEISTNAYYSSSFEGSNFSDANIAQYRWIRVNNGVALEDVFSTWLSSGDPWYAISMLNTWEGDCSITLIVTDSAGNESEPFTMSWFGEEQVAMPTHVCYPTLAMNLIGNMYAVVDNEDGYAPVYYYTDAMFDEYMPIYEYYIFNDFNYQNTYLKLQFVPNSSLPGNGTLPEETYYQGWVDNDYLFTRLEVYDNNMQFLGSQTSTQTSQLQMVHIDGNYWDAYEDTGGLIFKPVFAHYENDGLEVSNVTIYVVDEPNPML